MAKNLTKARFDVFAIGTRKSGAYLLSEELSYWSDLDENVLGVVFRDRTDSDFGWILMVRDRLGRFRSVDVETSIKSQHRAEISLRIKIQAAAREKDLSVYGLQGDEANSATDLLSVLPDGQAEELHPNFKILMDVNSHEPARKVLKEIGPWLTSRDPHFVREFQFHQFDQRLWEIYLWASFREGGFDVEICEAPDFVVSAPGIEFTVEATTVAESVSGPLAKYPKLENMEDLENFSENYMPIKYGSPLYKKLSRRSADGKRYWDEGCAIGKPFVLAIADFHKQASSASLGSMTYSQSAIWRYLYGMTVSWTKEGGTLKVEYKKMDSHTYEGKTIPSGFFNLPDAEHVSAVMFSNAGTLPKFVRIGRLAGFSAPESTKYFRIGFKYNPDPNAEVGIQFCDDVDSPDYSENWSDELQVFHNPNAKNPASKDWFAGLQQHYFEDEKLVSIGGAGTVISSFTMIVKPQT